MGYLPKISHKMVWILELVHVPVMTIKRWKSERLMENKEVQFFECLQYAVSTMIPSRGPKLVGQLIARMSKTLVGRNTVSSSIHAGH